MQPRTSTIRFERTTLIGLAIMVLTMAAAAVVNPVHDAPQAPLASFASAPAVVAVPVATVTAEALPAPLPRGLGALNWHEGPGLTLATAPSSATLDESFTALSFELYQDAIVPRLFMASFPQDLNAVREVALRKALFFKTVLPLVLQVNEEILNDRRRIWRLKTDQRLGRKLPAAERLWLAGMAKRYKTRRGDLDALMAKVDIIPPSLAIAQAATESGWGTSRFVREGNAMFGEWTWDSAEAGIVPGARDSGKTHRIRAFDSLLDSVRSYALNLNRHRAYRGLHADRARMRERNRPISGHALAGQLQAYSERGAVYIEELRVIIDANELSRFDGARLAAQPVI